uniref:Skp1 domain-containing protein n=1 Tax=Loa loa TaxID=7209 RepID=A0A1I7W5W3_LOALO
MYYIECIDQILSYDRHYLYITCRYFHDYIDSNPEENSIHLEYESITVKEVLSFAFTGICQIRYYGGSLNSNDFAHYQQFLACLNLLKPLMYQELLQMYDDDFCRIFQKLCKTARPPCEANTLQFLRLAIRFGFPKLEACTIARLVMITKCILEHDDWMNCTVPQLSPLERIELLKAKCKQVYKWIGQGLMSDIPEPSPPPMFLEQNLFQASPILRSLFTYDAMEELE